MQSQIIVLQPARSQKIEHANAQVWSQAMLIGTRQYVEPDRAVVIILTDSRKISWGRAKAGV